MASDRARIGLEFARMSGMLYSLNPRNYEDRWYAAMGVRLNMLCDRIDCDAIATAQDSLWAGNTYDEPLSLADVDFDFDADTPARQDERPIDDSPSGDNVVAQSNPSQQQGLAEDVEVGILDIEIDDNGVFVQPDMAAYKGDTVPVSAQAEEDQPAPPAGQVEGEVAPSASQELHDGLQDMTLGDAQHSEQSGPSFRAIVAGRFQRFRPSGSARTMTGGTRHLVPDSAINGFVSIDFTPEAMEKAAQERQKWTTDHVEAQRAQPTSAATPRNEAINTSSQPTLSARQDQGSQHHEPKAGSVSVGQPSPRTLDLDTRTIHRALKRLAPTDPTEYDVLRNPWPLYRDLDRDRGIVEFKIINAESKRLPSRQEPESKPPWDGSLNDLMDLAQCGNLKQIRVFFASPHWNHQDSIMLFASSGDFETHTIATRVADRKVPTFKIKPWSMPVWIGSEASQRREAKIVDWINTTFSRDAMLAIAYKLRDETIALRNEAERQKTPPEEDNADSGDGPSGPPGPPEPSANPKTNKRRRDPSNPEQPARRSSRPHTKNPYFRRVAESKHDNAPRPLTAIRDAGEECDVDQGQDDAGRGYLAAHSGRSGAVSQAHPTREIKPLPRLPGRNGPDDSNGKGKARADPVDNEQDDASSAQSELDDARPTKKAREHSPAEASDASEAPPPDSPVFSDMSTLTDISVLEEQIQKANDALTALQKEKKRILEIQALQAATRRPINRALTGQPSDPAGPSGANGQRSVQEPSRLTRSRSTRY